MQLAVFDKPLKLLPIWRWAILAEGLLPPKWVENEHTLWCCIQDTNMKRYVMSAVSFDLLPFCVKPFRMVIFDWSYKYKDNGTQFAVSRTQTWSDYVMRAVSFFFSVWGLYTLWYLTITSWAPCRSSSSSSFLFEAFSHKWYLLDWSYNYQNTSEW